MATAADRRFALWFCAAALATLALFRLAGAAVVAGVPCRPAYPLAHRSARSRQPAPARRATPLMLVSVGLGLSTLVAVALIQGNVQREILDQLPADAPSFFFVDIQDNQLARFETLVQRAAGRAGHAPGA